MLRKITLFCFLGMFLQTMPINAQENQTDTVTTYRVPQFENEHVKVWKTVIAPNQPLKMHRHDHARIVVGLQGGTLKKIEEDGLISDLVFETGKAYWFNADPKGKLHGDQNNSDKPVEVMVIEFKH